MELTKFKQNDVRWRSAPFSEGPSFLEMWGSFLTDCGTVRAGRDLRLSNVDTADAMGEAFARSDRAFMPYSAPKVVKLRLGSLNWMKT